MFKFMSTPTTNDSVDIYYQQCFRDIDGQDFDHTQKFQISMLRLGRILTKNESPVFGYTAAKVVNAMRRHRTEILGWYRPMDVRQNLWELMEGEIVGGGIRVEYCEEIQPRRRNDPPHFSITFSKIYWHTPSSTSLTANEPIITEQPIA
jgi:hypothetical protein